jgi:hypothetical protein
MDAVLEDILSMRDPTINYFLNEQLPGFVTHYFEADKGPFRNICDLSEQEIESVIEAEKHAQIRPYFAVLGHLIEPRLLTYVSAETLITAAGPTTRAC